MTDFASLLWQRGYWGQTLGWCLQGARRLDQTAGDNIIKSFERGAIFIEYLVVVDKMYHYFSTTDKTFFKEAYPAPRGPLPFRALPANSTNKGINSEQHLYSFTCVCSLDLCTIAFTKADQNKLQNCCITQNVYIYWYTSIILYYYEKAKINSVWTHINICSLI